jgi:hypothetical protein
MSLRGKWRIVEMPDYEIDTGEPAYIVFRRTGGEFAIGCLTGAIYGSSEADAVEFTWEGNDEMEPANGEGWADLQDDGSLEGEISINNGDDIEFVARRSTSSTTC